MPIKHEIRDDLRLISSIHRGVIPDQEFLRSYMRLLTRKNIDLSYNQLIDLRHTDSSIRAALALRYIAEEVQEIFTGKDYLKHKTAIIAPKDVSYGLGRMYQSLCRHGEGRYAAHHFFLAHFRLFYYPHPAALQTAAHRFFPGLF